MTKRFRDHVQLFPKRVSQQPSRIASATFKGEDLNQNPEGNPKINPKKNYPCKSAPNNGHHTFDECYYVNSSLKKPLNWSCDPEVLKRFEKASQNPRFRTALEATKKRLNLIDSIDQPIAITTALGLGNGPSPNWAFDTAADGHVCNDHSLFTDYFKCPTTIFIGDTQARIEGYGTVHLKPSNSYKIGTIFELHHCAYVPGFHINILSATKARNSGIHLNSRAMTLESPSLTPLCKINEDSGILLIKWGPPNPLASPDLARLSTEVNQPIDSLPINSLKVSYQPLEVYSAQKSSEPAILKGLIDLWHSQLGHPSADALKHLDKAVSKVKINNSFDSFTKNNNYCSICCQSKSKRQISRIPIKLGQNPFKTLH